MTDPWKLTTVLATSSACLLLVPVACHALLAMPPQAARETLEAASLLATIVGLLSLAWCLVGVVVLMTTGGEPTGRKP
jgi:hypothetical protein